MSLLHPSRSKNPPPKIIVPGGARHQAAYGSPVMSAVTVTCYRPVDGEIPVREEERSVMRKTVPWLEWRKHYAKDAHGGYRGTEEPADDCLLREEDMKEWRGWDGNADDILRDDTDTNSEYTVRTHSSDNSSLPFTMQYSSSSAVGQYPNSSVSSAGWSRRRSVKNSVNPQLAPSVQIYDGGQETGIDYGDERRRKWWQRKQSNDVVIR